MSRSICSASREGGIVTSLVGRGEDTSFFDPKEAEAFKSLLTPTNFGHASLRSESIFAYNNRRSSIGKKNVNS